MKAILIFLVCVACLSAQKYNDQYLDTLFSDDFTYGHISSDAADNLLDIIVEKKHPMYEDALIEFITVNKDYDSNVFPYLIRLESEKFISWLKENGNTLSKDTWLYICRTLEKEGWHDSLIHKVIMKNIISHGDDWARLVLVRYIENNGKLDEIKMLSSFLNKERDINIIGAIYSSLCRYDFKNFTNIIKPLYLRTDISKTLERVTRDGIKKYNRYDLLPELINLSSKLKSEKDVIKKGQYVSLQKELDKTIPYLEQKKKEKAPIGLPLDWGVDKRE